jgi:UDP-glucose 4-epimerase
MKLLVTGGAGYIGSHVVAAALQRGHQVEVVDDLSTGVVSRIPTPIHRIELAQDKADEALAEILTGGFDAVIHLAAKKQVGESVLRPEHYYRENVGGLLNILEAMKMAKIPNLVFSSSAAAYGMPDVDRVSETEIPQPINPYGQTKLIGEWLAANANNWGLKSLSLRYFNVAGSASVELKDTAALNLIPIAINQIRAGQVPTVFGDDYPTPDGTCIRDYIHVSDLAEAHLTAVDYLESNQTSHEVFNIGTGKGSSVLEVLDGLRKVSGVDFEHQVAPRRAGDPPRLVADVTKAEKIMGFKATKNLTDILASAWN